MICSLNRTTTQLAMHDACHCSQVLRLPEVVSYLQRCFAWDSPKTEPLLQVHRFILFYSFQIYFLDMLETTKGSRNEFGLAETFLHDGYAPCIRDKTLVVVHRLVKSKSTISFRVFCFTGGPLRWYRVVAKPSVDHLVYCLS